MFVELRTVFDTVSREKLWEIMMDLGINRYPSREDKWEKELRRQKIVRARTSI